MADEKHSEGHGEESHGGGHGGGAHGGGAHEEHEGAPEWLISFADNVALMMGFFVILLAMNMKSPKTHEGIGGGPDEKGGATADQLDFVLALREAFNPIDLDSRNPSEAAMRQRKREKMAAEGRSRQPADHGEAHEWQSSRPTELSNLGGNVAFADDSDTLSPAAEAQAVKIAERIRGQRYFIEVRGHASPSETFRNVDKGLKLSFARATAVAHALNAAGVSWEQMRIELCSDNERNVERSYDREADRLNQRVEVVVTGDRLPPPGGAAAPSKASEHDAPAAAPAPESEPAPRH